LISFDFSHDGNDYTGTFETWDAQIEFYPDDLAASRVHVTVDLTSAVTGTKLYDDSLRAREWFDVKTKPTATVILNNFVTARAPGTYLSKASLTLKDITVTVPFSFELLISGDTAVMNGRATLTRKVLDLGQDSDPDAGWVNEEVLVKVSLKAEKK